MCIYILLQTRNMSVQIILINLNVQIIFGKAYHSQSPIFSSPLFLPSHGPNFPFSTLFS
jgi:hypothetical protein